MSCQRTRWVYYILAGLFCVYTAARVITTLPAIEKPRALADTDIYLRISSEPILSGDFLYVSRPFVFPLLLRAVHQNFQEAASVHLGFSILAWGLLALAVAASFRILWLRSLSFILILALSLVRHLAGWDFAMMTESLSLSWLAVFLAAGIWLLHGWRMDKVLAVCIAGFFLAFTRDTNAYLLAMWAGMLFIAVLIRWAPARTLVLTASFLLTFLLSNANAEMSKRWFFPLFNVIGRRILPNERAVAFMGSCGMPVNAELMRLAGEYANGQDKAFFADPTLGGFRIWLDARGKSCYARWLIIDFWHASGEVISEFDEMMYFGKVEKYFSRSYRDILPSRLERLLYPVYYVQWIWGFLTLAAVAAVVKRTWVKQPLWSAFVMLSLTIFPHLFITYHGDAMATYRHAVSVGMQLALCTWLFVLLALEWIGSLNTAGR
jgi:hypothetical protein